MIKEIVVLQLDLISKILKVLCRLLEGICLTWVEEDFLHLELSILHVFKNCGCFLIHILALLFKDFDSLWLLLFRSECTLRHMHSTL